MPKSVGLFLFLFLLAFVIATGSAQAQPLLTDASIERARTYEQSGKISDAVDQLSKAITRDPQNWAALYMRGADRIILGKYVLALDDANQSLRIHSNLSSQLLRAHALTLLGKYDPAIKELNSIIASRKSAYSLLLRSCAYMLSGRYKLARQDAYSHLNLLPRSVLSFEICSLADAFCGQSADSIAHLVELCDYRIRRRSEMENDQFQVRSASHPVFAFGAMTGPERQTLIARFDKQHAGLSSSQYHFARASILFCQQSYNNALDEIKACGTGEIEREALVLSSLCYLLNGDLANSKAILDRLISRYPTSKTVLQALDIYFYKTDQRRAGIAVLNQLIVRNPTNCAVCAQLAKIYRDLNDQDHALEYCNRALKIEPRNREALHLKATIENDQGQFQDAQKTIAVLLSIDPNDWDAYLMRATILVQQQNWTSAIESLNKVIDHHYDMVRALQARAACYGALKKHDLEKADFERVNLEYSPDDNPR